MKTCSERTLANGNRRVVVDLAPGEKLVAIREDRHYKLGQPVEDVVASHIIADATEVTWCSGSQAWAES